MNGPSRATRPLLPPPSPYGFALLVPANHEGATNGPSPIHGGLDTDMEVVDCGDVAADLTATH